MKKCNSNDLKLVTNAYFDDTRNHIEFHQTLLRAFPAASRQLPDELTKTISDMAASGVSIQPHFPHWHQMTKDDDERSLRNLLKVDDQGMPRYKSRNSDLLRYIDLCLQFVDVEYRRYVKSWCLNQVFDEGKDDLF